MRTICCKQRIRTPSLLLPASAKTPRLLLPLMALSCFWFGLPMSTCAYNRQVVFEDTCSIILHAPWVVCCFAGLVQSYLWLWIVKFLTHANRLLPLHCFKRRYHTLVGGCWLLIPYECRHRGSTLPILMSEVGINH